MVAGGSRDKYFFSGIATGKLLMYTVPKTQEVTLVEMIESPKVKHRQVEGEYTGKRIGIGRKGD